MTDLRRLYLLQALRAFVYGFASVILGSTLASAGMSGFQVGALFAAMLLGAALSTLLLSRRADQLGRRKIYMVMLALMGLTGTVFALSDSLVLLVLAALTGSVSVEVVESGPFTSIEQAMIPQIAKERTTHVFGVYNAIASLVGAAGALCAGGPELLARIGDLDIPSQRWFLVYPVAAVVSLGVARKLSGNVEAPREHLADTIGSPLRTSRRLVYHLSALMALDSFAGGFLVQSFIVYWFTERYETSAGFMGVVLAITGVIQAVSFLLATRVAKRFGLLNTAVFTHLASNIMLFLLPLSPNVWVASAIFLLRFPLSQMDVPTRQAYIAALVPPEERSAAASVTNAARTLARPLGAPLAGIVAGANASGLGFVISGVLKSVYDVLLYYGFRHVPIDEMTEVAPARPDAEE